MGGAIVLGFFSFRMRRINFQMNENVEIKNFIAYMANDVMFAFFGYVLGHGFACDYIFKKRLYVRDRLHYEKDTGFDRNSVSGLLEEYPLKEYRGPTDADLKASKEKPVDERQAQKKIDELQAEFEKG